MRVLPQLQDGASLPCPLWGAGGGGGERSTVPHMIAHTVTQEANARFHMLFIRPCNPIDEGYVILLIMIQSPVLVTCLTFPGAVIKYAERSNLR